MKTKKKADFQFEVSANSPLAAEHEAVTKWVEDAVEALGEHTSHDDVELKTQPSGRVLLDSTPPEGCRYVMAALEQVAHYDRIAREIRSQGVDAIHQHNPHLLPDWNTVWRRERQALAVVVALMRRSLPLQKADLLALMQWCNSADHMGLFYTPVASIAKALERFDKEHGLDEELKEAARRLATHLRGGYDKDSKRIATSIDQLCGGIAAPAEPVAEVSGEKRPVQPAAAGNERVLDQLKRYLGLIKGEPPVTEETGPDRTRLRVDSPLAKEHALLGELIGEVSKGHDYYSPDLSKAATGRKIMAADEQERGRILLAAAEREISALLSPELEGGGYTVRYTSATLVGPISQKPFKLDRNGLFDFLLYVSSQVAQHPAHADAAENLLEQVEKEAARKPLSEGERYVLHLLRAGMIGGPPLAMARNVIARLTTLIGDGAVFFLVPGEAWSDAINEDLGQRNSAEREKWTALLKHLLASTGSRPTDKWLKSAQKLIDAIGAQQMRESLLRWFALVKDGRSIKRLPGWISDSRGSGDLIHEENATVLRGMMWIAPLLKRDAEMARAVAATALSAYRKVPGVGPRAVKVGNAAIYALSEMANEHAVAQLAMLKVRVKFGTAQKEIEKAFTAAAEALGMPRDEIEELAVPTYGLEEVGLRREEFGEDIAAELHVDGSDVSLSWFKDGKAVKSVPAKAKSDFKEELKELQTALKDISAMLPAQSERLDSMFLAQKRWPIATWRERYLDHPLIGTLARRLIWNFTSGNQQRSGIWLDGKTVDVDDKPLEPADDAHVELWHPIGRPMDDVLAWREWLGRHEVKQPFKQAHREIYLLTDAERRTNTYSNRFAAHIIRQHQFNALCAARGWKNKLRLMVDDAYPPASRLLPQWGLRAEFWIEGIGDGYGTDTNDSGVYLRLATDQVRFYEANAAANLAHAGGGGYGSAAAGPGRGDMNEPLPLANIPPLVFSEIMRDVDLFVGVASVGNDPTWQDGGPDGRYLTYWQSYSFGDLTETAKTRKAVLEKLLPRLKIASRCSLSERFLVVRGELRTYKIHLGSGNIMMEPNDQYLCIVPERSQRAAASDSVFLPFEGDSTLSVIISKAFLLAEDKKITDPTIVRQIK